MPSVSVVTMPSLRAIIAARSRPASFTSTPCCASPCRASAYFSLDSSNALLGMAHPTRRQVPPSRGSLSTQAVSRPNWAARIAAA